MIVLDTNVLSEVMRGPAVRSAAVVDWLGGLDPDATAMTVISVAEIATGVWQLPAGKRRDDMIDAADRLFSLFSGRILPFDVPSARLYPEMTIARKRAGLHFEHVFDLQIAAIASARSAAVATRNVSDFEGLGLTVINPWDHPAP